jgi:hypothetical protein
MLARFNQKTTGHQMQFPESSGMPMFPGVDASRVPSAGAMLSIVVFDRTWQEPLSARRHSMAHRRWFQAAR